MTSATKTAKINEALAKPVASFAVSCVLLVSACTPANATIDNTANASGTVGALQVLSNDVTVQVPVNSVSSMQVTKTADVTTNVAAGQVVTYTYVVRNTGNTAVTNVSLSDSHNASGPVPVPGGEILSDDQGALNDSSDATSNDGIWSSLAPGDAITLTATYTVTQSDVDTLQ
jgi:large repetitive protein